MKWFDLQNKQEIIDDLNSANYKYPARPGDYGRCPTTNCGKYGKVRNEEKQMDICEDNCIYESSKAI